MFRIVMNNGDEAFAEDPESATLAARTLWDEMEYPTSASFYLCDNEHDVGDLIIVATAREQLDQRPVWAR